MNVLYFESFVANRPDKGAGLAKYYSGINYLQSYKSICNRLQMELFVLLKRGKEFYYLAQIVQNDHFLSDKRI